MQLFVFFVCENVTLCVNEYDCRALCDCVDDDGDLFLGLLSGNRAEDGSRILESFARIFKSLGEKFGNIILCHLLFLPSLLVFSHYFHSHQ